MGELYDAPNQQVVRADGSGPWEEGTGGSTPQATSSKAKGKAEDEDKGEKSSSTRSKSSDRSEGR